MSQQFNDQVQKDIDWFLDNVDLDSVREQRALPIQDGDVTKYLLFDSIKYAIDLIDHKPTRLVGQDIHAKLLSVILSGNINEPEEIDGSPPGVKSFSLVVKDRAARLEIVWHADGKEVTTTVEASNLDNRTLLRMFAIVRCTEPTVRDNLPGLGSYSYTCDCVYKSSTLNLN